MPRPWLTPLHPQASQPLVLRVDDRLAEAVGGGGAETRPAITGWPWTLTTPATEDQGVPLPASPGSRALLKNKWAKPRALDLVGPAADHRPVQRRHLVQARQDGVQQRGEAVVGGNSRPGPTGASTTAASRTGRL